MRDTRVFRNHPFAYYLMAHVVPLWYHTLLKVLRKDISVELQEIQPNELADSANYIIIPPGIDDAELPKSTLDEEPEIRDAIAARRRLRVSNHFLYYSFLKSGSLETYDVLGITVVYNVHSIARLCSGSCMQLER